MGGRYRYNLVLNAAPMSGHPEPFFKLAHHVREFDPEIRPHVITYDRHLIKRIYRRMLIQFILPRRPSLTFSPTPAKFRPGRGVLYQGQRLSKSLQFVALESRSIPVPLWVLLTKERQPDLSGLGPYVVVKPDRGGVGAEVKIMRRGRVKWRPVVTKFAGPSDGLIVQAFIYTGPWPVSYRVSTLFGQALWSIRVEASHTRPPLSGPEAFDRVPGGKGLNIVSASKGCSIALSNEEDVIQLAERAHEAFPEIPVLGLDIVREHPTGQLYVLEVNPESGGWQFASEKGLRLQREFGFSLEQQFDGLKKAAKILAERTRKEAY